MGFILPTGHVFPLGCEEGMWLFYVKATYVYIRKYNSTAHETVVVFYWTNYKCALYNQNPDTWNSLLKILFNFEQKW